MDIKVEELPQLAQSGEVSLIKQFSVEVPAAEINARLDEKVKELAPKVELKGFRKGHVPESQVRQRYGEELLRDILQEVINETSEEALKDKTFEPATPPRAHLTSDIKEVLAGTDLKYKITIELQPQFELTDLSQLALEKLTTEVKEEHITEALNDVAVRNPVFEDKEAERPAQNDDKIVVDIIGTLEGKPFENNEKKDMSIHLGKGFLQENIEKAIVGKNAGDNFNVPIGFPADHPNKVLAGKLVDFAVSVRSVVAQRAAVVDEVFAKALGADDVDSLRQKVRDEMERADEATARADLKRQIAEKLESHTFPLPPSLLEEEKRAMLQQIQSMQQQLPPAEQARAQAQMAKIEQNINEMAKKRVKVALVLSRIAKDKKLEVSRDELKAAVEEDIQAYEGDKAQAQKLYNEHPELVRRVYAQLLEEKTIDEVIKIATISEKKMDRRELYEQESQKNSLEGADDKQSLTPLGA